MDRAPASIDQRIKWAVRISFTDGDYTASAWALTKGGAFSMALIDARMGSSTGTYSGKVKGWEAVPAEGVPA